MMDYYGGHDMMSGYGLVGLIINLLLVGVIVWGVIAIVRHLSHAGALAGHHTTATTALETLKLRYAKGEIDKEEFVAKRHDIEN